MRGARIVLVDDDGVRANMTASWLAQMAWEVYVLDDVTAQQFSEQGPASRELPPAPPSEKITPQTLAGWLEQEQADASVKAKADKGTVVLDFSTSANYVRQHVPGAWFALRSQLAQALQKVPPAGRYVVTCGSSQLAAFVIGDLAALTDRPVFLLEGGNGGWEAAGLPIETGATSLASPRIDRYRRPYEGTDNPASAMQAYLDWEFGLVEQLGRDGTHGFQVI